MVQWALDGFGRDSGGALLCDCVIDGVTVLQRMSGLDSAKAACVDPELRAICMNELP